ncbi:hypothetical protein WME97_14885 [Sorangium sp. So ce367]|uniref:hypothetical protein n=1 Tax=Sorangium sp. So ce367 TaxID=3133305 RepID=UPI003F630C9C
MEPELALEPLFAAPVTRSLLGAALAAQRPDGPVCVEFLVERLARSLPIERVPRALHRTLRMGVQVLVDRSDTMMPFLRDAAELVGHVQRVVGAETTNVLRFAQNPLVAGAGPKRLWRPYAPPAAGTPVLVLSDLGIGGRALDEVDPTTAWLDIVAIVERAGCPLVGFVPYPRERWPAALVGRMALLTWDRTTTVADAARAVRGGRRRP